MSMSWGWVRVKARGQEFHLGLPLGYGGPRLGLSSAAFPDTLTETFKTCTDAYLGCQHQTVVLSAMTQPWHQDLVISFYTYI